MAAGITAVEERVGPLAILVNNAGMQLRAPLLQFEETDWHRVVDTNLTSAFLTGRECARRMVDRGGGKIVKLTKGMCADWGPAGIQVNGLGPGYIETELTRPLVPPTSSAARCSTSTEA